MCKTLVFLICSRFFLLNLREYLLSSSSISLSLMQYLVNYIQRERERKLKMTNSKIINIFFFSLLLSQLHYSFLSISIIYLLDHIYSFEYSSLILWTALVCLNCLEILYINIYINSCAWLELLIFLIFFFPLIIMFFSSLFQILY